jgi:hypothetical protein
MPHRFIWGETLIFIGETLGYSTLLKKDDRIEFYEYHPSGGMFISTRTTEGHIISYIAGEDVDYFIRDPGVRDYRINEILKHER